jgi:hypothetical protein
MLGRPNYETWYRVMWRFSSALDEQERIRNTEYRALHCLCMVRRAGFRVSSSAVSRAGQC